MDKHVTRSSLCGLVVLLLVLPMALSWPALMPARAAIIGTPTSAGLLVCVKQGTVIKPAGDVGGQTSLTVCSTLSAGGGLPLGVRGHDHRGHRAARLPAVELPVRQTGGFAVCVGFHGDARTGQPGRDGRGAGWRQRAGPGHTHPGGGCDRDIYAG